jgi:hypothetical protein
LHEFNKNRHIEFRIVLLHVLRPVLLAELLDHGLDDFRISDGGGPELRPYASRLELRFRALYGQEISFSPSKTNQTGIEIVRPDFLPITLILI